MPRGDKSSYTGKQKRQAEHIEEGYEHRGVSHKEAERRAWTTVNAETHGGKKTGSGRGKKEDHAPSRKGGCSAARPPRNVRLPNDPDRRRRRHRPANGGRLREARDGYLRDLRKLLRQGLSGRDERYVAYFR